MTIIYGSYDIGIQFESGMSIKDPIELKREFLRSTMEIYRSLSKEKEPDPEIIDSGMSYRNTYDTVSFDAKKRRLYF